MLLNIFTGQTTTNTGTFDVAGFQVVLGQQATDRRAQGIIILLFQRGLLALRRGPMCGMEIAAFLTAIYVTLTSWSYSCVSACGRCRPRSARFPTRF